MFEFIPPKTIFLILHLMGVVLGMGAAFMTDIMFMKSARNIVLDEEEVSFIALGSTVVWAGLILIILSGAALFYLNSAQYLASDKFLVKMTVVLVLTINGMFFHFKHLPFLRSQINQNLTQSLAFKQKSYGLFISGAISSVSWLSAFVLGMLKNVPYGYGVIISTYTAILVFAILTSLFVRKFFLR